MLNLRNSLFEAYGSTSKTELKLTDFVFWDCNNYCDFCFQHDKEFKQICSQVPNLEQFTSQYVTSHITFIDSYLASNAPKYQSIKLTLMGGELFAHSQKPEINQYFNLLLDVIRKHKDKISIQVVSNLMHGNLNLVLDVVGKLKELGVKYILNTSFDFGQVRFQNVLSWKLFLQNIDRLVQLEDQYNIGCGVIMTKHMLESLRRNDQQAEVFKKIYDSFYVDFAKLSGPFEYKLSFDEQVELWKIIIDKFPKLVHTSIWCENPTVRCCLNNHHVLFTGNTTVDACVSFIYELYTQRSLGCAQTKTQQIVDVAKMYNCLGCKHFKHCIPQCPLDDHYDKCDLKEAIDYLMEVRKV